MRHFLSVALVTLAVAPVAAAQAPMTEQAATSPRCPADAEPIPAELAGWTKRRSLVAATNSKARDAGWLTPGIGLDVTLVPTPNVTYVRRPEHPGGSVSFGGMLAFVTDHAGTVRIGIGSSAWLDLLDAAGNPVASTAHGHGPNCSGIRKMVDFPLKAGRYTLQIAGNGSATLPLIIASLN